MEEQKQNQEPKNGHSRITLLSFFYTLSIISIISLVCLVYSLHLSKKNTEDRLEKIENSIYTIQGSQNNTAK